MGLEHHGMPDGKGSKHNEAVYDLSVSVRAKVLLSYILSTALVLRSLTIMVLCKRCYNGSGCHQIVHICFIDSLLGDIFRDPFIHPLFIQHLPTYPSTRPPTYPPPPFN